MACRRSKDRRRIRTLGLESLEARYQLYGASFGGGLLTLTAISTGEQINLGTSVPSDGLLYVNFQPLVVSGGIGLGGQLHLSQVSSIRLVGGAGNDNLQVNGTGFGNRSVQLDGNDGNDQLFGGADAHQTLNGGRGN